MSVVEQRALAIADYLLSLEDDPIAPSADIKAHLGCTQNQYAAAVDFGRKAKLFTVRVTFYQGRTTALLRAIVKRGTQAPVANDPTPLAERRLAALFADAGGLRYEDVEVKPAPMFRGHGAPSRSLSGNAAILLVQSA